MKGKLVKASAIENQVYEVFPSELNPQNIIFGGQVLVYIDKVGGAVASFHSGKVCVTAGLDHVDFIAPARKGDFLMLRASVNNAWEHSCEVGVKVFVKNYKTQEIRHLASAYLTYVALDDEGNLALMPPVIPKTREEKRRYKEAEKRRQIRLERKQKRSSSA